MRDGDPAGEVSGTLVVGDELLDLRIELSMLAPDGTPIEVEATLVETDTDGRWTLSGDLTVDGRTDHVIVDALYHGVFRHGSHAWAELSFSTSVARSTIRRRRLTIDADVIFDAPTRHHSVWPPDSADRAQKSMRITTRRNVGLLTSAKPASANVVHVPTWSSSSMTFVVVIG